MTELAAADPEERTRELIRLTRRLTALLEEETGLFEARKALDAARLQDEKGRLATVYRRESAAAKADASRLSDDPALRAELRAATEAFASALKANGEAVRALQTLTEGLVKAIADEAARQQTAKAGYGPNAGKTGVSALAVNARA